MTMWIIRCLVVLAGPTLGYLQIAANAHGILIGTVIAIFVVAVEIVIERISLSHLIAGFCGAFLGTLIGFMFDSILEKMEVPWLENLYHPYSLLMKIILAYLGVVLAIKKFPELGELDKDLLTARKRQGEHLKVVDTSAIIDGRIVDIVETRFLSGTLIIPRFVLRELQLLADSADGIKRSKGKRGLEILARLQENPTLPVRILDRDFHDIQEVDTKLVNLAKELNGKIVTTDFNLNKVAALQGTEVLNINDLSNALKPIVLPGETMNLFIMKEGKERDQGVGYLDDGTMVVVEDGRRLIGKRVEVLVSSILQTSAGRMVFTKVKP